MLPTLFRDFRDGETVAALGYDIVIRRRKIGDLAMTSGSLVACDPLAFLETEPFEQRIPRGQYPVVLLIATLRDESAIAYAIVEVGDREPVTWEEATVLGEDASVFGDGSDRGYPVDSSVACFMDGDTASALLDYTHAVRTEDDEFRRSLLSQLKRRQKKGYSWAEVGLRRDVKMAGANGHNVLAFEAGYGPGLYTTWLGFDEDRELTRVVTDFEVLDLRFNTFRWGGKADADVDF